MSKLMSLIQARRAVGQTSILDFLRTYLPNYCTCAFSSMHETLNTQLLDLTQRRGVHLALAAPRGHAKSTLLSLAYVLWSCLYNHERHILLISATQDLAVKLLRAVKEELEHNALLRMDFPEVCAAPKPRPWRSNSLQLPTGVQINAYGAYQSLRGVKHRSHRPSLILADDLEAPEHVIVEEQRDKLREWVLNTLLHVGDSRTNVLVTGTVQHHDSLLARLVSNDHFPGWRKPRYKAMIAPAHRQDLWDTWAAVFTQHARWQDASGPDAALAYFQSHQEVMLDGTQVLWPQRESYYDLMVTQLREGRHSFYAEKQNEPLDPELCIFREENLQYWDQDGMTVDELLKAKPGTIFGACDPSLGKRAGSGDYTAIVLLLRPKNSRQLYVIAADIARRTPDETVESILHYGQMYPIYRFAVESNHFQKLLLDQLKQRTERSGVDMCFREIENTTDKRGRITAMEADIAQGRILFSRRHGMLLDQLRQFPVGKYDDGPDALEMAVTLASAPQARFWGAFGGKSLDYP